MVWKWKQLDYSILSLPLEIWISIIWKKMNKILHWKWLDPENFNIRWQYPWSKFQIKLCVVDDIINHSAKQTNRIHSTGKLAINPFIKIFGESFNVVQDYCQMVKSTCQNQQSKALLHVDWIFTMRPVMYFFGNRQQTMPQKFENAQEGNNIPEMLERVLYYVGHKCYYV